MGGEQRGGHRADGDQRGDRGEQQPTAGAVSRSTRVRTATPLAPTAAWGAIVQHDRVQLLTSTPSLSH
jgi:hypothetical protein